MSGADATLQAQIDRLQRQQAAIVQMARGGIAPAREFDAALLEITRIAAETIDVERASVWLLSADRQDLRCVQLYTRSADVSSSGVVLTTGQYFRYFAALESGRAIDAHDAREDARTSEFRDGYLVPLGITSMMDAPIRMRGEVLGVFCNEHVGPARHWTPDEVSFAGAVADQIALLLAHEERERMRQAMVHAQKLESLGQLAGGVAHDFNNLLTVILGNAALARDAVGAGPAKDALADLVRATQHATHLTKQLLAYSGRSPVTRQPMDLSKRTRDVCRLVQASLPPRVRLMFRLAERLPPIEADASQMAQVVTNLVLNAADAIGPAAGEIRVTTGVVDVRPDETQGLVPAADFRPGRHVFLEVADDGCGLDREALGRIFDPFYSTKGPGRGLGLAAVHGIVRGHRGAIGITSEPGKGTGFRVLLPAPEAAAAPAVAESPAERKSEPAPAARSSILVVDDQQIVRIFAERALRAVGHEVKVAANGAEALDAVRGGKIELLLLDVGLGGEYGPDVLEQIHALHPDLPVILMSGFSEKEATAGLVAAGRAAFLAKPFTPDQLAAKVREVLRVKVS